MTIRAAAPADHAAIRELLLAAFPGPDEAELVDRLRADGNSAIELVAEEADRIVGHILFSPVDAPFRALALAPVAVAPHRRGKGVGSALIGHGHEVARGQGWAAIFVLGEPEYYGRFGYAAALASDFATPYAGPYFMVLALGATLPATAGEVRHAPAFASLG